MITKVNLLNIHLNFYDKEDILEYFLENILNQDKFCQIISINTENFLKIVENPKFLQIVKTSQIHILDGSGIKWAIKFLQGTKLNRLTGIDLMEFLVKIADRKRFRIAFIGGKANLADQVRDCYQKRYPNLQILSDQGISNINKPQQAETERLKSIVLSAKPHLVFVSFGSPAQELWIEDHKEWFKGSLVVGVGGAFALAAHSLKRAPLVMQELGLEWLFRLFQEPLRFFRQIKILKFIFLVFKEKLKKSI